MNNLVIKLRDKGIDGVVGRVVGIKLKDNIFEEYSKGDYQKIVLDFTGIEFVTSGFAKELFGGLFEKFGSSTQQLLTIKIDNNNDTMKSNLLRALAVAINSKKSNDN